VVKKMAKCVFCGETIKPGTGFLYVKKEGTALFFCSRKCEKNTLLLHRNPAATKWTQAFVQEKHRAMAGAEKAKAKKELHGGKSGAEGARGKQAGAKGKKAGGG